MRFAGRFAVLAEEMAGNETDVQRKKELLEIAETCRHVPANPARSFKEAIQTVWFIMLIFSPSPTTTIGRFDQYMYPFYKTDIAAGRITDEEVLEYRSFPLKAMELNAIGGKEVRKRGVGRARWYNMTIGGIKSDGSDATNELSYLVLGSAHALSLYAPHPHHAGGQVRTLESLILKGIEAQAKGLSMPAFIGDPSYINFFLNYGVSLEHARDYVISRLPQRQPSGPLPLRRHWHVYCTHDAGIFPQLRRRGIERQA